MGTLQLRNVCCLLQSEKTVMLSFFCLSSHEDPEVRFSKMAPILIWHSSSFTGRMGLSHSPGGLAPVFMVKTCYQSPQPSSTLWQLKLQPSACRHLEGRSALISSPRNGRRTRKGNLNHLRRYVPFIFRT